VNRFELIRRTLMWQQVAAAARAKESALRDQLTADARAEYAEQGTAPTWRLPDIGTVSLPVSKETVYVADEAALLAWVKEHYAGEVETLERVRPAFLGGLLSAVEPAGDVACVPLTGQVIPGLAVRQGGAPGSLSFRPSTLAKQVAAEGAARLVDSVEREIEA
jgi:hypothetical protein